MTDIQQVITALTELLIKLDGFTSGQALVTTEDCDALRSLHQHFGEIIQDLTRISRPPGP